MVPVLILTQQGPDFVTFILERTLLCSEVVETAHSAKYCLIWTPKLEKDTSITIQIIILKTSHRDVHTRRMLCDLSI